MLRKVRNLIIPILIVLFSINAYSQGNRAMQLEDIMKFKDIRYTTISDDGKWVAYSEVPDRGDPVLVVMNTDNPDTRFSDSLGTNPKFNETSEVLIYKLQPTSIEKENAEKKSELEYGIGIMRLPSGEIEEIENTGSIYKLTNDGKWLAYKTNDKPDKDKKKKRRPVGSKLRLRELSSGNELEFDNVTEFDFDSTSSYFSYIVAEKDAKNNGLYLIDLKAGFSFPKKVMGGKEVHFGDMAWHDKGNRFAFISGVERFDGMPDTCSVYAYMTGQDELMELVSESSAPSGWRIPFENELYWTEDEERLFFGFKPVNDTSEYFPEVTFADSNYYDESIIREKTELDVWHHDDPRIKTHQKTIWNQIEHQVYLSVYDFNINKYTQLADEKVETITPADNKYFVIGFDRDPYMKEMTWEGFFNDVYAVSLRDGTKKLVAQKLVVGSDANLSPQGDFIAFYNDKEWYLYNTKAELTIPLTAEIKDHRFWNDEHDLPAPAPHYGIGGWLEGDDAVFIYDKFDIWKFYTRNESKLNQTATEGVTQKIRFRFRKLDPEKKFFKLGEEIPTIGFDEKDKSRGIYTVNTDILGPKKLLKENNFIRIIAKAKDAKKYILSKEKYDLFPDLWVSSDTTFTNLARLTDVNPQMRKMNWGKAQQVKWKNYEGQDMEGILILPDDYQEGKKYPTYVYFYDKFSDYLHRFFQPKINHRPVYPQFIGSGYIVFMPDIKYTDGDPGYNSYSCITSGVRHLAKKGYVDTTKVCLQGHSWGGYQTAYMVTATDLFAAACAGAPVSNMTSAYSGIRLGSGLARQFQYEMFQSRIGGTLWDSLDAYIRNSPVFRAPKAETPLLIMFGDVDEAVPWEQGIELYLSWRRLNKHCIFLQYRKEPHHPRKYENKLDYNIKMKEFFDHYCLGTPAPEWMTVGKEYKGK